MGRFLTSFTELTAQPPRHLLLLYSGGLDGSYLLHRLSGAGLKVTALNVRIGTGEADAGHAAAHADRLGAGFLEADATAEFFADFLPAAIHADAFYQGQFPVGSTLTRPLMARTAVTEARRLGCDAVGHTATYMQNSALRITASVAALAPDIDVVAPFLGSDIPRERKLAALADTGVALTSGIHSVDTNPWSRVIECGTLESPENRLDESVFTLTRDLADTPAEEAEVELVFRAGLPAGIDGAERTLADIVFTLNSLAGTHGIGRFAGLEDTPFGVKNHEVRESPAAAVITAAHRALANAVFDTREHTVRAHLATEWTNTVVGGGWFGHLGQALAHCLAELDEPVTGTVRLRLHRGTVTVVRLDTANGLYYTRLGQSFHDWMNQYSYAPWLSLATLGTRSRRNGTKESTQA
jgi:argininosuccinate synthase